MKRLSPEALRVLGSMTVEGRLATISTQLDRKLYLEVNKALEALGGKWNRSAGGHTFEEDPEEPLSQVGANGGFVDKRQELGFFQTPEPIAERLVRELDILTTDTALEPSAGRGRIARELDRAGAKAFCVEIDPTNVKFLRDDGHHVHQGDFLKLEPSAPFDRVAMNPPFAKQADIDHVTHAMAFLKPGGRLGAVMAAGVKFRENRKTNEFRTLLATNEGRIVDLPEGAFAAEGTNVNACLVFMTKAAR